MGRERDRKRASAASDHRRAGAYLAQLGWLEGYPEQGETLAWRELANNPAIPLDGSLVAKARRTARTVMREHPDGLAKLVGDVDRWWTIVDHKLAWMSAAIAGKTGPIDPLPWLPPRAATGVRALLSTAVGPAARALACAYAGRPDRLADAIAWLAEHRTLTVDAMFDGSLPGWRVPLALSLLVAGGGGGKARAARERGVDALIRLCEIDAPNPSAALQESRAAENRLRKQQSKKPILDAARSRVHVIPFITALPIRDEAYRQRALELVAEAKLAEALAPWQLWARDHEVLLQKAAALAESNFESVTDRTKAETKVIARIEKSRAAAPVEVSIKDALLEIGMLSLDDFARVQPSIVRVLAALPAGWNVAGPARMLLHIGRAAATADDGEHFEYVWDALASALDDGAPLALLSPWQGVLTESHRLYVESDICEHANKRPAVERAMRVLLAIAWSGSIAKQDVNRSGLWLEAGLDEALVAEVTIALREVDGWMLVDIARAAIAIAAPTVADLAAVAKTILEAAEDWRHSQTQALCSVLVHAALTGGGWIARAALDDNQAASLAAIGETLTLMPRTKWPRMTKPRAAQWIARYPEALHPALLKLATVDDDAEATAAKRLADDVPDPAALREEIAALRSRLDRPGAAKRLANLEDRLAHPQPASVKRLANLAAKIERTARDLGLSRFTHAITDGASERVVRAFGLESLPAWANAPKTIALLFALLSLDEYDRALAGRMIRARGGDRPWDLRDDPKNRAFLAELRTAGIDPDPWLDDSPRVVRDGDDVFTLELTGDPIEVFAMGAHFGTCLSPDGGNFFSVVANAADVNKRVIYAKRDGRVIGRCLLALTEGFAILSFHVYAHEQVSKLEQHIRDFVLELANRMHTSVAPRGTVRLLLANDWYDDGPRDLVGRFRNLDDAGLDFRNLDPAALVGVLRAALDREIDDVTLPIILGHGGIVHNPALVVPLAPFILASSVPLTRVTAADLALQAGDRALADRFLGDHVAVIRLDDHPWHHGEMLAQLRPSYTLTRLRETRRRDVRDWEDEPGDRCAVAGVALEALHRPKQAAAMYRLALRDDWLIPHIKWRLDRLDG